MSSPQPFEVGEERAGHRPLLTGPLDIATTPILERAFESVYEGDAAMIVVDLTQLSFMDSTGIGALTRMSHACEAADRLRIVNGSRAVVKVLDITGVRPQLAIISSHDDPLAPL
jgi:anti-sigma B factor antagonist